MESHKIENTGATLDGLFAASNSSSGFKSYYHEIFDKREHKRIYVIKADRGREKVVL